MTIQEDAVKAQSSSAGDLKIGLKKLVTSRASVLTTAAVLLILYFDQRSGGLFISTVNASLLMRQTAVVAVLAAGVAILIVMGEIDLSIGSAVLFTGLVAAKCQMAGWGLAESVLAAIVVGALIGLAQGFVVAWLAVPSFVVTLGGFLLWHGLGLLWSDAATIGPVSDEFLELTEGRMPTRMVFALAGACVLFGLYRARTAAAILQEEQLGSRLTVARPVVLSVVVAGVVVAAGQSDGGLPTALAWIAVVAVLLSVLLTRAKFGRRAFLVGSNREAAAYAGIDVKRVVLLGFVLMGAVYGVGGSMLVARIGSSTADSGAGLELVAIAAAVIGGNSLRGGVGSIMGAVMGAFLLATIDNGMALLGVSSYAQDVVKALILVTAVGLDGYFIRRGVTK